MRAAILVLSFLPFVYYGLKDNAFHFKGRKVSRTEHVLHLFIGMSEVIILCQGLRGDLIMMFVGLVLFGVLGGIDEYIFHRDLPGAESDLHAKEHLALLIFIVIAITTTYLEKNHWQLPNIGMRA